jgi:hypothetical protein
VNEVETVRELLATAAAPAAGEPIVAPVEDLLRRARRDRRRRRAAAYAVVLAVAAAVAVPVVVLDRQSSPPTASARYPTAGPGTAAALGQGHWTRLPEAPILGRSRAATAWTGTEMIIWGGLTTKPESPRGDGAAYRPADKRWAVLPPAPLTPRYGMAYAWTNAALFVWGGSLEPRAERPATDGALYDPATRSWRTLPPAPQAARSGATAVWTGTEVVVVGGRTGDVTALLDAAAYNPATNRWRLLPALPAAPDHGIRHLVAVAAGGQVYVWAPWVSPVRTSGNSTFGIDLFRLDTATDRWSTPTLTGDAPTGVREPLWTGLEFIVPAAVPFRPGSGPVAIDRRGSRLDPADGRWRTMAHGPVDDENGRSLWTGAALITFDATAVLGAAAAWDPATDRWTRLPDAPASTAGEAAAVWTGTQLLIWGEVHPRGRPDTIRTAGLSFGA